MAQVINEMDVPSHSFVFHGTGERYFLICVVNVLLTIITLGIYLPWALMKCKRYLYANMEVNGQRFSYGITGGNVFVSCLVFVFFYFAILMTVSADMPLVGCVLTLSLLVLLIFMAAKGLRYQALMTSLNGVRFSFNCSLKGFWWVTFFLPILMAIGIFNGTLYSLVMSFLWSNTSFGIHRFKVKLDTTYCIKYAILAFLALLPFLAVAGYIIFDQILNAYDSSVYANDDIENLQQFMEMQRKMIIAQLIYYFGIAVSTSYLTVSLRNHFMSNLSLNDGRIRFRSTLTYHGMLYRMCALVVISGITGGLAYPLLKIWMIDWQAKNTYLLGDLDDLPLINKEEQPDKGFLASISRGIMPSLPFL
ncbi:YjgN family protein [Escherichia coli]|uniref:YjgN family protein n=1 Tax=Escherichia coli TaxID=562 RepID=UPI000EF914AA|nr:YjgN family protein [Escherichia coli]MCK3212477.1 YjgN family protein [Escherichia coli]MDZ8454957.1 YjgN family protein [Escherichia coli]MDZ8877937.1 YjgN family protein [Escherichia coli]MDZ9182531.1 YjgN family protein [Escherichia coli]MDZ9644044.1 YjgN family protein [Escherichia coli]